MAEFDDQGLCPFCHLPLEANETLSCPVCTRVAHTECWQRVGRCATKACEGRPPISHGMETAAEQPEEGSQCRKCGYRFGAFEKRCPRCEPLDAAMEQLDEPMPTRGEAPKQAAAEPTHQLGSIDDARRGPTSDPFRRVTAAQDTLEQEAPVARPAGRPILQDENTSGGLGAVPRSVRGWNWGGLLLGPAWLAGHGLWGLLLVWVGLAAASRLLPVEYRAVALGGIGLMALYLAGNGNALAWKARRFNSVKHFKRVQQVWAIWGAALALIGMVVVFLGEFALDLLGKMEARVGR